MSHDGAATNGFSNVKPTDSGVHGENAGRQRLLPESYSASQVWHIPCLRSLPLYKRINT